MRSFAAAVTSDDEPGDNTREPWSKQKLKYQARQAFTENNLIKTSSGMKQKRGDRSSKEI